MFANNPEVTDAFIIKKFKRDLIEETFSGYKKSAKETEVREAEIKSNKQATIFAIVFVLVSCAGIATCVNNSMETEYNDPACAKLGLKSNWNNTKCY